jgi:hypothetical protein
MEKIKKLEGELIKEMQKKNKTFFYEIRNKKIIFDKKTKDFQKKMARSSFVYLIKAHWSVVLVSPIIYSFLIPVVFLDALLSFYQFVCFPIYKIPRVNRKEYFQYDRKYLSYLNVIEKVHCLYCSYINGVISFFREISARTEQRWCPIKHSIIPVDAHSRYFKFFDYGDASRYEKEINILNKEFNDLKKKKSVRVKVA